MPCQLFRALAASTLAFAIAPVSAEVIRVPADFPTIQAGIDHAVRGDTVLVAPGTYNEAIVWIAKGITVTSEKGAERTIVDAGGAEDGVYMYVAGGVGADRHARLAGFTIRNAGTNGVHAVAGRPIIEDNIITGTGAGGCCESGAIYADQTKILIRHNLVEGNSGPGIVMHYTQASLVEDNRVQSNRSGGIVAFEGNHLTVVRNVVGGNGYFGFGFMGETTSVRVADNLVVRNGPTRTHGMDVWDGVTGAIVNNTFADDGGDLGSIFFFADLYYLTFANNVVSTSSTAPAVQCDEGVGPLFSYNDVWNAAGDAVGGECVDSFSQGAGDFSLDPRFGGGANVQRYKPMADSPLIDAGDNGDAHGLNRDFSGRPRIIDGGRGLVVDIGAFEFDPNAR